MTTIKHQVSKSQLSSIFVWLLILIFVLTFATLSLQRHAALATNGLDLGNVNQALWNTAQGNILEFTNMAPVRNRLALHVEPILFLFVPFYWVGLGGPSLLLIAQAIVVGLGALPLYWLACDALGGSRQDEHTTSLFRAAYNLLPAVFPLAYLLLPALEAAVMYDFHAVTLAPTFLLFAFYYSPLRSYAREGDRVWLFGLFTALALACKEDMGLTVAMLGLYVMVARWRWRWGGVTGLVGAAWFGIAVFLIQPQFSPTGGNIQADRYAWLGDTPLTMMDTVLRRPSMVWDHLWERANLPGYLGGLLLPTAFLSLLCPLAWLPGLPSLAINLLSDNPFTWRLEDFHYAAPIVPFVFIAAIRGLRRLSGWVGRWSQVGRGVVWVIACGLLLAASLVYHDARGFSPLAWSSQPRVVTQHHRRAEIVFVQIPPSASLFAQSNLNPHVSGRRVLYQDPALLSDPALRQGLPPPDYLLFDVSSLLNQNDFHRFIISDLLNSGEFGPVVADDGYLLLQRGASPRPLPDQFFDFVRADPEAITYPLEADFGHALRLRGFDLLFNRAEEVQVVLYFEALDQLDEDYFLSLYLLDRWGTPLGATVEDQPALVWHPTRHWKPGELVKVTFNTLPWYTRDLSAYRLAVGVMQGRDPWQPASRLLPSLRAEKNSPFAVRLPEEGTLLELARFRQVSSFGVARAMPAGGPVERTFEQPRVQTSVGMSLGGEVRLLGYDIAPASCRVVARDQDSFEGRPVDGCWLELVLYWQTQQPMNTDYTVFVHLVGPDGQILAQRDAPPDGGAYPTRRWAAGEVIADPVRVPLSSDLPPGSLELAVGLYRPDTGQRLPALDAQGQPLDEKVILERIVIDSGR
ncbi:MAG: DUF2079 domain-containing protein [Anaerolineales bacterium]|nr:MAG: DUF2079 domain-containing protein [Anaerolineales bacterium]